MSLTGSRRLIGARGCLCALALAVALSAAAGASSTPDSARSELQLELADLLLGDERYWEAIGAYERAKVGATPAQTLRAAGGLVRSLLTVAEVNRAHREALFLGGTLSPNRITLVAWG